MIVAASSDRGGGIWISVWAQQETSMQALQMQAPASPKSSAVVGRLVQLAMAMATVGFLYQNIGYVRSRFLLCMTILS
jgi:hypothetical protein